MGVRFCRFSVGYGQRPRLQPAAPTVQLLAFLQDYPLRFGRKPLSIMTLYLAMQEKDVPDDVREFIIKHITRVAQCEALLLLSSRPADKWSLRQIAVRLYASEEETAQNLNELCAGGLLTCSGEHYSLNTSAENIDMLRKLREVYARSLIQVTHVIHSMSGRPSTHLASKGKA
jgi:hypothetical protein